MACRYILWTQGNCALYRHKGECYAINKISAVKKAISKALCGASTRQKWTLIVIWRRKGAVLWYYLDKFSGTIHIRRRPGLGCFHILLDSPIINESSSDRSPGPSWLISLCTDSLGNLFVLCQARSGAKELNFLEENIASPEYSLHQYNLDWKPRS